MNNLLKLYKLYQEFSTKEASCLMAGFAPEHGSNINLEVHGLTGMASSYKKHLDKSFGEDAIVKKNDIVSFLVEADISDAFFNPLQEQAEPEKPLDKRERDSYLKFIRALLIEDSEEFPSKAILKEIEGIDAASIELISQQLADNLSLSTIYKITKQLKKF